VLRGVLDGPWQLPLPPVTLLMGLVGLLALVLAVVAIVLATVANRRWVARPRPAGSSDAQAPEATGAADERAALRAQLEVLGAEVAALREAVAAASGSAQAAAAVADAAAAREARDRTALRHVALVRYDAFADVGGRLSHSVAVLDDTGSGLVLTTLSGKADVRTYVRAVSAGVGEVPLTAEEQQAVQAALAPSPAASQAALAAEAAARVDLAPAPAPDLVPATDRSRP
jgi:hypothetical protein